MKNNNLLASVTLFGELYNSETYKGIPDILAEFIKGALINQNTYSFNSYELKLLLKKVYGFEIPESVLRTVVRNRLKEHVNIENKIFHIDKNSISTFGGFDKEVNAINLGHDYIFNSLKAYVEKKNGNELKDEEKENLFRSFAGFLLDSTYSNEFSNLISAFLISNESNNHFKEQLHQIKEGVILYQGITYSTDISQLGNWDQPITIYLSTEHLFSCLGYNGALFEEIFNDFYQLVLEINKKSKKDELIKLRYLEETRSEISEFFQNAEDIKRGKKRLNPTKVAMKKITDECKTPSEVKIHLSQFYNALEKKGIEKKEYQFDIENSEYNVVDSNLIEELKKEFENNKRYFDENYCYNTLRIFTRINTFRKGKNDLPFEQIRHIYITENGFAKYLAHNVKVKFGEYDVAFAKDIDFITSKFWFKLKKGFSKDHSLPKSFDVLNKAKIVISSHLKSTLSGNFERLQRDFKDGKLTEEEAVLMNENLKETPSAPEEMNADLIDKSLDILFDENLQESILREHSKKDELLRTTISEKEALEAQLREIKEREMAQKLEDEKVKANREIERKIGDQVKLIIQTSIMERNYFLRIVSLTVAPILIALCLKLIPNFNNVIESLGNFKYLIYGILILITLIEILGRSYLFEKDKVKRGWSFVLIELKRNKRKYAFELTEELKKKLLIE